MVAHDHVGYFAFSGDEQADLPVYFPRQFRKLPGEFVGDDVCRWRPAAVELPDPLLLIRSETGQIAVNLVDGLYSLFFTV
jgi:hypothetical protein